MQLEIDVIAYLKTKNLITDDGVDAFRDFCPESPDHVVVIQEYNSPDIGDGVAVRSFQISVRDIDPTVAKTKARQICESLRKVDNFIMLTDIQYALVEIRDLPIKIKVDEQGRNTYAFNIGITSNL